MYHDRPAEASETTPYTAYRLEVAERERARLAALLDEVRALRPGLPEQGPASWRSAASEQYDVQLGDLRNAVLVGCDQLERAHDHLVARIAAMRRALESATVAP
ncbi:hypothetical protein [Agromyces larvae]|uniref:DUF4298 domain-containing protein n=1 Tax=Agromyces larvae TaxID=2929802 RepID=A0ABY4C3J1_9MICO|nr:hypothetical protein [Agromyces larvae]UOE43345.1 hypothetical protein MTO99_14295 [Agromyces larvae]